MVTNKAERKKQLLQLKQQEQRIEQKKSLIQQMKNEIDLQIQDLEARRTRLVDDIVACRVPVCREPFSEAEQQFKAKSEKLFLGGNFKGT